VFLTVLSAKQKAPANPLWGQLALYFWRSGLVYTLRSVSVMIAKTMALHFGHFV
jgi:hypothetical protein